LMASTDATSFVDVTKRLFKDWMLYSKNRNLLRSRTVPTIHQHCGRVPKLGSWHWTVCSQSQLPGEQEQRLRA
jgi:hypothetical protein